MTGLEKAKEELKISLRNARSAGSGELKDGVILGIIRCIKILDRIIEKMK